MAEGKAVTRERAHILRPFFCAVLILALLAASICGTEKVYADEAYHDEKSRAIAIVFDNSGSMYVNQNLAWSQATYAMEVFASMLNDGDLLQIYPMGEITAGGKTYSDTNPLEVQGGGDVTLIQDIFTPQTVDTPISTIRRAHDGILKTDADEKWLVVLTDGDTFYSDELKNPGDQSDASARRGLTELEDTQAALTEMLDDCAQDENVIYLGIGGQTTMPDESQITPGDGFQYSQESTESAAEVTTKLAQICNRIFGRDELEEAGGALTFDLPMKKLILFVQGSGIENVTLSGTGGTLSESAAYAPHYPVNGGGDSGDYTTDENLSGVIKVYENVPEGSYEIRYSGETTSVTAYYEPDVTMAVTVSDSQGNDAASEDSLTEGTYRVHAELRDPDGNPTTSSLLKDISYQLSWQDENGKEQQISFDEDGNADLTLKDGQVLSHVQVKGTYLSDYHIIKTAEDLGWHFDGSTVGAARLDLSVSGDGEEIPLSELENKGVFRITAALNGEQLSGDQLKNVSFSATFSDPTLDAGFRTEGDTCVMSLSSGDKSQIDTDRAVTGQVTGEYSGSDGVKAEGTADLSFSLTDDGWGDVSIQIKGPSTYHKQFLFLKDQLTDDTADTYTVTVSRNGSEPFTDEEIEAMRFDAVISGDEGTIETTAEPIKGGSGWLVTMHGTKDTKPGSYVLKASVSGKNNVGEDFELDGEKGITVERIPRMMKILLALVIAALIVAVILWWLSRKVLPKNMEVVSREGGFKINGEKVKGHIPSPDYSGKGKKTGAFSEQMPRYNRNALVRGGVSFSLAAISPRRIPSAKREAMITEIPGIRNLNGMTSAILTIGGSRFRLDDDTRKLVQEGVAPGKPVHVTVKNGSRISLSVTYRDGTSAFFEFSLKFS